MGGAGACQDPGRPYHVRPDSADRGVGLLHSMTNRIVVGLGNPGPEYDWTPHNLGFHVLDRLARPGGSTVGGRPGEATALFEHATRSVPRLASAPSAGPDAFAWAELAELDALLVKPWTYMNLSGEVVAPIVRWRGVEPGGVLVVYDDMDLELGRLRIRPHGGTGGHRGMISIVNELGTDRFPRLRIGVGRPRTDAARHVLARLAGDELRTAETSVEEAALAVRDWLETGDVEQCMTRFHSRWNQMAAEQAAPTTTEEEPK